MKIKQFAVLFYCVVFTTIGAVGGWKASEQGHAPQASGHGHGEDDHAHGADASPTFSELTLRNLGVEVGSAEPGDFVAYRSIPATIERTPATEHPLFAIYGGSVRELRVEPGVPVQAGEVVAVLVRDAIPRPTLALTLGLVQPDHEEVHKAGADLVRAMAELKTIGLELARLGGLNEAPAAEGLPLVPRQTLIDLQYRELRTRSARDQARIDLEKHGFTEDEIDRLADGKALPVSNWRHWRRALESNGLWPTESSALFDALPEALRERRWTTATIAELGAQDLITAEFVAWMAQLGAARQHFLEIAALLQMGHTLEDIQNIHRHGALEPIVEVRAPKAEGIEAWDVEALDLRAGARVERGTRLLTLIDPRQLFLRTKPVGAEEVDVLRVIETGAPCRARPLVPGTGPEIEGFTLDFIARGADHRGSVAYARVQNSPLMKASGAAQGKYRSWRLRDGMRYVLRVPTKTLKKVFVLPRTALTEDGPKRVVFIRDGDSFQSVEVEVAFLDEERVVIPINAATKLFPGDPVVTKGAFEIGLALNSGSAAVDPHAGHSH